MFIPGSRQCVPFGFRLLCLLVSLSSDILRGSVTAGPECYMCTRDNTPVEQCNEEQPDVQAGVNPQCRDGEYCSIKFFLVNGQYKLGHVSRLCIDGGRYREISAAAPFTNGYTLQCASIFGSPSVFDCICEGKNCNWFPKTSVIEAYRNHGLPPHRKSTIPPRKPSSSSVQSNVYGSGSSSVQNRPSGLIGSGSSSSGSGSVQSRPMGLSGSGGSAGSISKPAAPSGSEGAGVPVNPSGSAGTGGSSSPGSQSGSGGSGEPAPASGSGGGASGTGGGSGSESSGTVTGDGSGDNGSGAGSGSGEGGTGGEETPEQTGEGSANGGSSMEKGGAGGASGSGQGTKGNGTDSAATQGSGSSLGLIAGIAGGLVAVTAIGGGVYYWHKNKQAKKREEDEEEEGEDDDEA